MTLEKAHISQKTRDKTRKALSQTTEQLDWARTTVTQHTTDITHIESLLKDCESTDEGESVDPEPGAEDLPAAIPQARKRKSHRISR